MQQYQVISNSEPALDLWARVMRTRNILYKTFARELLSLDIKPEQLGILNLLQKANGVVTPVSICRLYCREPQTISVDLRRLEAKGLIRLIKDLARKNMIRVVITAEGVSVWERGTRKTHAINQVFNVLSQEETSQLGLIIDKLADSGLQVYSSGV